MKRYIPTVIAAFLMGGWPTGPAPAANVDDLISVRIVCSDKAALQEQADAIFEDKSYVRANELLRQASAAGVCAVLPMPVQVMVTEVGPMRSFVDHDGDTMSLQVIAIKAPTGATFYSVELKINKGA